MAWRGNAASPEEQSAYSEDTSIPADIARSEQFTCNMSADHPRMRPYKPQL